MNKNREKCRILHHQYSVIKMNFDHRKDHFDRHKIIASQEGTKRGLSFEE